MVDKIEYKIIITLNVSSFLTKEDLKKHFDFLLNIEFDDCNSVEVEAVE